MNKTDLANLAAELNSSMLGRSLLTYLSSLSELSNDSLDHCLAVLKTSMAEVFIGLAAEIVVIRQWQPNLTAEQFSRLLLAETNLDPVDNAWPDVEEDQGSNACNWYNDPSLTTEERNSK